MLIERLIDILTSVFRFQQAKKSTLNTRSLWKYTVHNEQQHAHMCRSEWWAVVCLLSVVTLKCWEEPSSQNAFVSHDCSLPRWLVYAFSRPFPFDFAVLWLKQTLTHSKDGSCFKLSNTTKKVLKISNISRMPMPAGTTAILLASEGLPLSHDALLWWDLLITLPPPKYILN